MTTLRRGVLVAVVVIGLGLAVAPAAFQMFTRAPKGGDMIEDFRPYMTTEKIDRFRGYLDEMGAAEAEIRGAGVTSTQPAALEEFHQRWPVIDDDMGDMLTTMRSDIGRFRGVSALPPFVLFPWFFVIPGLLTAGVAGAVLVRSRRGAATVGLRRALVVLGVGVVAAPAIFQMFTRAPGGAEMIDDFRPLMTETKVTTVQGYFLALGAGEGVLRTDVLPARRPVSGLPATERFVRDWPAISNEMAPMIGTMADNLDNFAAVDALPPFWLFPWFFVVPGLLVAGLSVLAGRGSPAGLPATAVSGRTDDLAAVARERSRA